jgi:tetratricopeptide (TPR) repeat protein
LTEVRHALERSPSADLYETETRLLSQIGRLQTTLAGEHADLEALQRAYDSSDRISIRRRYYSGAEVEPVARGYREAVSAIESSLLRLPIGIRQRDHLIRLDFVFQNKDRSLRAVGQLAALQDRSSKQLAHLGRLSADAGQVRLSERLWSSATNLSPHMTEFAILHARDVPGVQLVDLLSDNSQVQIRAARYILGNREKLPTLAPQFDSFFLNAIEKIRCESSETRRGRSGCEELIGDLYKQLGRDAKAIEHYRRSIDFFYANESIHHKLIKTLFQNGREQEACELMSAAENDFPNSKQLVLLRRKMATVCSD